MRDLFECTACRTEFTPPRDWYRFVHWPKCPECGSRLVERVEEEHHVVHTPMGHSEHVKKRVQTRGRIK